METCAVLARDIKFNRGNRQILDVESFRLEKGEIMALIGITARVKHPGPDTGSLAEA
jgi:ABC-type transporter Mla maintaining outer membrane lipid asymmetry ATPase subunit MlaF